jgi:hypothetical protein
MAPFRLGIFRRAVPLEVSSADGLSLTAPDGPVVPAAVRFSTDGREWVLTPPPGYRARRVRRGAE